MEALNNRGYSSINNEGTSSLFLTEPAAPVFPPNQMGHAPPYANVGINQNIFQQSINKATHQNMHSAMRASAFHSAAGTTDDTPHQFKHLQNSQLSQYGPSMTMSKGGHTTFGGSQWNATFNQRQPPRWERRDGSTLSSAGNHIFTQMATANAYQHAQLKQTGRSSASVNDPY